MPGQGRLTLKRARRPCRPDLHRIVPAAASDEFAISTEADRIDPVLEISQHVQHEGMNSSNTEVINSPAGVPGQGRLALKCARRPFRPDLEGLVTAATDEQIAICAEADRIDTVFGISQ